MAIKGIMLLILLTKCPEKWFSQVTVPLVTLNHVQLLSSMTKLLIFSRFLVFCRLATVWEGDEYESEGKSVVLLIALLFSGQISVL